MPRSREPLKSAHHYEIQIDEINQELAELIEDIRHQRKEVTSTRKTYIKASTKCAQLQSQYKIACKAIFASLKIL